MECKAKLLDVARDIMTGLIRITFTAEELPLGLDKLQGKDLLITAKEWKGRRTMSANAYYWQLIDGAVSEARILGIETLGEDALREMFGEHYEEHSPN